MDSDIIVRKVTQDVLLFQMFKHKILLEQPSPDLRFTPEITDEFMNNLCISVWMQVYQNEFKWGGFFQKNFERMTSSSKLFAKYISYGCYNLNVGVHACQIFLDTLSLVSYFVVRLLEREVEEFLLSSVDLFCAFIERELRRKFEEQGGWKNFHKYLEKVAYLEQHRSLIRDNKGMTEFFEDEPIDELEQALRLSYETDRVILQNVTCKQVETNEKVVSLAESVASRELCEQMLDKILMDFAKIERQVEALYRKTSAEVSGEMASEAEQSSSQKDEAFGEMVRETEQSSSQKDEALGEMLREAEQSSSQKDEAFGEMVRETEQSSSQKDGAFGELVIETEKSSSWKDGAFGEIPNKPGQSTSKNVQEASRKIPSKTKYLEKELERLTLANLEPLKSPNTVTNFQNVDITNESSPDLSPELRNSERVKELLGDLSIELEKLTMIIQSVKKMD